MPGPRTGFLAVGSRNQAAAEHHTVAAVGGSFVVAGNFGVGGSFVLD